MEARELICIGCPLGCPLTVTLDNNTITVTGNTCKRGDDYARKEILSPTRIVTSTVHVAGGVIPMASVKTMHDIPKDRIYACMVEIRKVTVEAPVHIGDVIIKNCAGTGVAIIATKDVKKA